jgi:hypothetical protein
MCVLTVEFRAIGCGLTTLLIPIMLNKLGWKTFLVFAALNIGMIFLIGHLLVLA